MASSMLEKETILSDRYLKPPYGGNCDERVNKFFMNCSQWSIYLCPIYFFDFFSFFRPFFSTFFRPLIPDRIKEIEEICKMEYYKAPDFIRTNEALKFETTWFSRKYHSCLNLSQLCKQ